MVTFYITIEERKLAQAKAAALDISKSRPPGQHPYVWDNRMSCVNRWYDYASPEDKIGTIYFEEVREDGAGHSIIVKCTTQMTHRLLVGEKRGFTKEIDDPEEHRRLMELFFWELLGREPKHTEDTSSQKD